MRHRTYLSPPDVALYVILVNNAFFYNDLRIPSLFMRSFLLPFSDLQPKKRKISWRHNQFRCHIICHCFYYYCPLFCCLCRSSCSFKRGDSSIPFFFVLFLLELLRWKKKSRTAITFLIMSVFLSSFFFYSLCLCSSCIFRSLRYAEWHPPPFFFFL